MVVNLSGRGDKDVHTVGKMLGMESHDHPHRQTLADLKAEGRPALVTYFMAGDPDYDTALEDHEGAAEGRLRHHRARHAVLRSDGRRPGDPGCGPARAESRQTLKKDAAAGARKLPQDDNTTPIVLMGYYNPIYIYGVEIP
jgi:tryptophan synthase alpha chain